MPSLLMSRVRWLAFALSAALLPLVVAPAAQADYNGGVQYPHQALITPVIETYAKGTVSTLAPTPICFDASESKQDECVAPPSDGRFTYFWGDGMNSDQMSDNVPHSTAGADSVLITVFDNGESGGAFGFSTKAFRFTFNVDKTVDPATNAFQVIVGDCLVSELGTSYRPVDVVSTNTTDEGHQHASFYPRVIPHSSVLSPPVDNETAVRVVDGTSATTKVMVFADLLPGLRSNETYSFEFLESYDGVAGRPGSNSTIGGSQTVTVQSCPGDGTTGGGGGDTTTPPKYIKPKATIDQLKAHAVRVQMKKGTAKRGKFKIIVDKPKLKPRTSNYKFTKWKINRWKHRLPYGTKVIVKAWFKKNGKWRFWRVDFLRVQPRRS